MLYQDEGLAFDLTDLKALRDQTSAVCEDLKTQRDSLKAGLDQLRKDWNTPAGQYFFSQIDADWKQKVIKFENTIAVFEEVLSDAITQYEAVLKKAKAIEMNLP